MEVKNSLCTQNYTKLYCEDKENWKYNAPHHFTIGKADCEGDCIEPIQYLSFQEGPIKEQGINGINNEDAILAVITRLKAFQESEYACKENEKAIEKLEECLMWLRKRTLDREVRNVVGTSNI
ncbi:ABC transporter ATPase [Clostridioides difficile]|nr:ABC transporter ATPase [Clostridioides difficile]